MTARTIIWKKPDGGVAVTHILPHTADMMDWAKDHKDDPKEVKRVQWVREHIGLDEREHAQILKAQAERDQVRVLANGTQVRHEMLDYECVGHGVEVPADRTFREAWTFKDGSVQHDMAKCREIHRSRLRAARAPKLAELDVEYMRALERADSARQKEIAAKKQALRDVTAHPAIESAGAPDELNAVWPEELK